MPVKVPSNNAAIIQAVIIFCSFEECRITKRTKTDPTKKKSGDKTCHDFIKLKSLHFLMYENDIAGFGSDTTLAAIDNITGRGEVKIRVSNDRFPEYCHLIFSILAGLKRDIHDKPVPLNGDFVEPCNLLKLQLSFR